VALYLDREGFRRTRRTVEVPEEAEASVEIELDPLIGYLSVNSEPPLAKVILEDGQVLGETPLNASEVPIGEHTYRVVKERYVPIEHTVTIEENGRYRYTHKLTLKPATLVVYSYPTGAQILLNSQPQAERTPTRFELPPGLYTVAVSAKGFTTRETRVELKATEEKTVDLRLEEGQTPEGMVLVPAGEFIRGADKTSPDERPKTKVHLDAFYIDKFEVTNEQFKVVFPNHKFETGEDRYPVVGVTWKDAKKYAESIGRRLPTEEEWEKAARGDDGREYPWGDKFDKKKCSSGESVDAKVREVGKYREGASPYGCMDMAGNAYEWTASWYQAYPGNQEINTKYGQVFRVLRGGSYQSDEFYVRCARRHYDSVDAARKDYGFRCAMDVR
jgi:formylglycine-generating enzyme required for sulfatase activity